MNLLWLCLKLSTVGALLWLDRTHAFQIMISRPIVAAPLVGAFPRKPHGRVVGGRNGRTLVDAPSSCGSRYASRRNRFRRTRHVRRHSGPADGIRICSCGRDVRLRRVPARGLPVSPCGSLPEKDQQPVLPGRPKKPSSVANWTRLLDGIGEGSAWRSFACLSYS